MLISRLVVPTPTLDHWQEHKSSVTQSIFIFTFILFWPKDHRKYRNGVCSQISAECTIPIGNYMFKVNNKNTRTSCEIGSKITIKKPERRQWRRSVVNFEYISNLVPVFLFLTLSRKMPVGTSLKEQEVKCNAQLCPNYFSVNVSVLAIVFHRQLSRNRQLEEKL